MKSNDDQDTDELEPSDQVRPERRQRQRLQQARATSELPGQLRVRRKSTITSSINRNWKETWTATTLLHSLLSSLPSLSLQSPRVEV